LTVALSACTATPTGNTPPVIDPKPNPTSCVIGAPPALLGLDFLMANQAVTDLETMTLHRA
jgi:hypothetical protein